ncbi:class I fructose-bisphosphate aldolase [Raineyella fluvialis]|uniref:Fructose-bisphosphate aldolase, class I n=1 Tax=Raineyella fluvialis TaxID=2662261 RepID=A0A5Q2F8U5_9ACTN|nr:hypothetical protein [Raineyella fluvialis]QGF22881.1 hypothetical protein Rai3103_03465 [Raineyella fluvialis]
MTSARLGRLFDRSSGRSFMVAMDRTLSGGAEPFAVDSEALVRSGVACGADALLLSPGLIRRHGHLAGYRGGPALVARIDFPFMGGDLQGPGEEFRLICSVEDAVGYGADAVVLLLVGGNDGRAVFADNIRGVADVVAAARPLGVPVIVEAVAWGPHVANTDPEAVTRLSRIAVELGADIIKTEYPGSVEAMAHVVDSCAVPVMVLGGPRVGVPQLLDFTRDALDAGVRGVIYGRNIWQREDSGEVASRIRALVHGDGSGEG